MSKQKKTHPEDDKRYHDTLRLLKNYREVVWSMELSVENLRKDFEAEYGSGVEEFLDSIYMAGADLSGTKIEKAADHLAAAGTPLPCLRRPSYIRNRL